MAYTKHIWVNDSEPDLDADNLNEMEQGIYDANNGLESKQDTLVSGTNIKTINGVSLLSGGDMEVGASIPIQGTAPTNPVEDDLWIDTSEPEEMQETIKNEYTNTTTDTYSCKYINDNLKAIQLYNDVSGTTGNVALSSSAANYSYIDIFFGTEIDSVTTIKSIRVHAPNGKRANLDRIVMNARTQASAQCFMTFVSEPVLISGTSISRNAGNRASQISFVFTGTNTTPSINTNDIGAVFKIYRVVGYK